MVLALAAHDEFAGAPVDVVELDRDDFRRAQAEPGEQKDHRIVATAEPSVGPDRRQYALHLVGRQMAGQSGAIALRDARDAERQVARSQAALEQVLKEVAQVGRRRLVPERRLAGGQPLEEGDDVARS